MKNGIVKSPLFTPNSVEYRLFRLLLKTSGFNHNHLKLNVRYLNKSSTNSGSKLTVKEYSSGDTIQLYDTRNKENSWSVKTNRWFKTRTSYYIKRTMLCEFVFNHYVENKNNVFYNNRMISVIKFLIQFKCSILNVHWGFTHYY